MEGPLIAMHGFLESLEYPRERLASLHANALISRQTTTPLPGPRLVGHDRDITLPLADEDKNRRVFAFAHKAPNLTGCWDLPLPVQTEADSSSITDIRFGLSLTIRYQYYIHRLMSSRQCNSLMNTSRFCKGHEYCFFKICP